MKEETSSILFFVRLRIGDVLASPLHVKRSELWLYRSVIFFNALINSISPLHSSLTLIQWISHYID
ncbi:unnamed protein product [Brassica oleracea var. botrytis]